MPEALTPAQPAALKITPMLRQYLDIKEQHPGAILFYRMGDFYEMFFEDAELASRMLGITLTSRSRDDEQQVEDPKQTKGIVRREVVRVVTPGVTTDEQLLDEKSNTFAAPCSPSRQRYFPQAVD